MYAFSSIGDYSIPKVYRVLTQLLYEGTRTHKKRKHTGLPTELSNRLCSLPLVTKLTPKGFRSMYPSRDTSSYEVHTPLEATSLKHSIKQVWFHPEGCTLELLDICP